MRIPGPCLALLALGLACSHGPQRPELSFRSLDSRTVRLADLRGQVVLLDFWATWCEPCKLSLPFYARLLREREGRGFSVVAASTDGSDEVVREYLARAPLPFAQARDPDGTVADGLGVVLIPTTFLLDRQGRMRFRHQGFAEADEAAIRAELAVLLAEPQ